MNQGGIKTFLKSFQRKRDRTIVIVDYGNVEKWKNSLKWKVGIREISNLVKYFSVGKQFLRRFYYGADYGKDEQSLTLSEWSRSVLDRARMNRFEVVTKRVKYIHNQASTYGFEKKCDLDVEMVVDLIKERDNYDTIILFSGDGDLMYAIGYLKETYRKMCIIFGARGHVGREVIDAERNGVVEKILYAEDFEYRLNQEGLEGKIKNPPEGGFRSKWGKPIAYTITISRNYLFVKEDNDMRIFVLGSTGMLGQMVSQVLRKEIGCEVIGTQSEHPDAAGYFRVEEGTDKLTQFGNCDYIINCIAITAKHIQPDNTQSVARAIRVNALFPHELAQFAGEQGMKVIHMSTDGVFLGKEKEYFEDHPHDCVDIYGKTKSLGEINHPNAITIRTSIIGPSPMKKEGLLEWFLSQPQGATVQGFINHTWHGVTTLQFADLCVKILAHNAFDTLRQETPVFHFAPNEPLTKYQLLNIFKDTFRPDITVEPVEDPHGVVTRIIGTKYEGLKHLYPYESSMEKEVRRLI